MKHIYCITYYKKVKYKAKQHRFLDAALLLLKGGEKNEERSSRYPEINYCALTAASSRTLQPSFIVRATPQEQQNNSPQGSKTRSTAVLRRAKATALRGKETVAPKNWRGCFLCQKRTSKKYTYFDIETLEKPP